MLPTSLGQLDYLSVRETWDVPFTVTGRTKKSSIKRQTGHCCALPRLESNGLSRGTLCHLQSPIKEKSDPPGRLRLEQVVQLISPSDTALLELGTGLNVETWPPVHVVLMNNINYETCSKCM